MKKFSEDYPEITFINYEQSDLELAFNDNGYIFITCFDDTYNKFKVNEVYKYNNILITISDIKNYVFYLDHPFYCNLSEFIKDKIKNGNYQIVKLSKI